MATQKTVNYTPEQTAKLVEVYSANPVAETVEALAMEMGKSIRSIVAKLSREGVYKAKEYTTKKGEKPIRKDNVADEIGMLLGMTEAEIESLTKANKTALAKIVDFVKANSLDKNDIS